MGYYKLILIFGLVGVVSGVWGQKPDPKIGAIERHYQFLESQSKAFQEAMQKENEAYRKFIQEERGAHQAFLETTIKYGSGLLALVGILLTFFGWNTFKGISESRKELEAAAAGRLLAFEKEMSEYKVRFLEAQQNLKQAEADYNQFLSYYKNANPREGTYLFLGSKEKIKQMEENEITRFKQAFGETVPQELEQFDVDKFYPTLFDVIVYRSNVDSNGEDEVLQKIIKKLVDAPSVPLVIYANGVQEYIKGQTDQLLRKYCTFHLATTPVSLIDNVASTYRVAKMLPKPIRTV